LVLNAAEQPGDPVPAALTLDRATAIAYIPTPRVIRIELSRISGTDIRGWWFNPRTGAAESIGTFASKGPHAFEPPGADDWVLVLDDASRNLPPPGSRALAP
jgi:hypothetical protein